MRTPVQPFPGPLFLPWSSSALFLSLQNVGDFNYLLSNRKGLLRKPINCSTFLYIRILPSCDGNNSQNPSKVPGQIKKDMVLSCRFLGFLNKGGNLCLWATDGYFKPRATDSFWSVSKFDAQLKATYWNDYF